MQTVADEKFKPVTGPDRGQHLRVAHQFTETQYGQHAEPAQDDRPEKSAHPRGAAMLQQEEAGQDGDGRRDDVRFEPRGDDPQPLDGAQDRNGRGDHAVAVKQRRGKQTEADQHPSGSGPGFAVSLGPDQCGECDHAALAVVVGPEDKGEVFERNDDRQGPEHQREHPEDIGAGRRDAVLTVEALPDGIQRAGADVAETNP